MSLLFALYTHSHLFSAETEDGGDDEAPGEINEVKDYVQDHSAEEIFGLLRWLPFLIILRKLHQNF